MSWQNMLQVVALVLLLAVTVRPLGRYMATVFGARDDGSAPGDRFFGPIERVIYRIFGVDAKREQRWNVYAISLLAFSLVSLLGLYVLLRLQGNCPSIRPIAPASTVGAFNAAISFVTNTNWQWFSGEVAISHLTQMLGFAVQNFVSAAVGLATVIALIRGITRTGSRNLGNFWVDLTRSVVRILLPLSLVAAVVLMSQGVVQNFNGNTARRHHRPGVDRGITEQVIPGGPVASQEAIKELGTNGGGFYNANSAHPFESPNGFTNFMEIFSCSSSRWRSSSRSGVFVKDRRQSRLLARRDGRRARPLRRRGDARRAERQPQARRPPGRPVAVDHAIGRQHGGQGGPLRRGGLRPVRRVPPPAPRPVP